MGPYEDLFERHKAVLPGWAPLVLRAAHRDVDGDGPHVTDAEGNQYLDFFGGILVTMSGYKVPEVVAAIKAQADKMLHTSTLYLIESQIELAEKIAGLSGIPDAKVFFTNSGTEANDAALMLATTYKKSNQVLAIRELSREVALRDRGHRAEGLVRDEFLAIPGHLCPRRVQAPQPTGIFPTRSSSRWCCRPEGPAGRRPPPAARR